VRTRRARRSNCSGRTSLRNALCGSRTWRDLLEGGLCQGIVSDLASEESDSLSAFSDLSVMISLSRCTTIRVTSSAILRDPPNSQRSLSPCLGWWQNIASRISRRCLQYQPRECGRPIQLTRSWLLHEGQAIMKPAASQTCSASIATVTPHPCCRVVQEVVMPSRYERHRLAIQSRWRAN
jgi:hypothetical protein